MAHTFVKIESYSDGCCINFTHLLLEAKQSYRKTLDCDIIPVEVNQFGYTQTYDFSNNPLTAGLSINCGAMPRKNQKRIDAAQKELNGMGSKIADLWNKREFDGIKALFS